MNEVNSLSSLELLEALAKTTRKSISVGGILIVGWTTTVEGGVFDYREWTGKAPEDYGFVTRDDAEALLVGYVGQIIRGRKWKAR